MDIASERARRKNRSSTNLSHLTLAPLTSKLPLDSSEPPQSAPFALNLPINHTSTSYLQGKSAPTTPRLLSRSPARHHRRTPSAPGAHVTKSKSSTQIAQPQRHGRKSLPGTMTPGRRRAGAGPNVLDPNDRNDSDWLLRTAAMVSTETRESKGQAWLVSRQSSTSLAGMRNDDDDDDDDDEESRFEDEFHRERESAYATSRRGSSTAPEDFVTPAASRIHSRVHSRTHSRARTRSRLVTPLERVGDGETDSYFPVSPDGEMAEPDFVNLDERLEALERDTSQADEAAVKRLMRRSHAGTGSWLWSLFSVEENDRDEASEDEEGEEDDNVSTPGTGRGTGRSSSRNGPWERRFEGVSNAPEETLPPPKQDEGGWQDAAWLLSVASKVMF